MTVTSGISIVSNFFIAAVKVAVGLTTHSIAILSEAVNNATDAMTSVITVLGTKLSRKRPDRKHPFGYGRIEYITSLVIAIMILVSGVELLRSSIGLIFEPEELNISLSAILILGVSAVIKFFLGLYMIRTGKRVDSGSLVAVGLECRNDSFASLITIITSLIFLFFRISLDAYAGILISAIILKAGVDVLSETISELIGRPGKAELAERLYRKIRATDGVLNAADLMLHNYGPDSFSGSVNVELDHKKTVGEVYAILHDLQLRLLHEEKVTMVFGVYAVDNDSPESRQLRGEIAAFVRSEEHVIGYHAVYLDRASGKLYCDLTVDDDLRDAGALCERFEKYMKEFYPQAGIELTVETDFV